MPARLVKPKFLAGKLHSGSKHGPIVTNPAQMTAIQISEARQEGHRIPKPREGRFAGAARKARR
jgi:hypothetical protein